MYTEFSASLPETSPEEHEASLLQLAHGLIAAARAWREGSTTTLIDPTGFVRNVNSALAGLNAYVRQQGEMRAFGKTRRAASRRRDAKVILLVNFFKGLFVL